LLHQSEKDIILFSVFAYNIHPAFAFFFLQRCQTCGYWMTLQSSGELMMYKFAGCTNN